MPNQLEVYKCLICGNIVEVLHGGGASLVCCSQDMDLMAENTTDAATEIGTGFGGFCIIDTTVFYFGGLWSKAEHKHIPDNINKSSINRYLPVNAKS